MQQTVAEWQRGIATRSAILQNYNKNKNNNKKIAVKSGINGSTTNTAVVFLLLLCRRQVQLLKARQQYFSTCICVCVCVCAVVAHIKQYGILYIKQMCVCAQSHSCANILPAVLSCTTYFQCLGSSQVAYRCVCVCVSACICLVEANCLCGS